VDLDQWVEQAWERLQLPGVIDAYRKILRHMNDGPNRQRYHTLRRMPHITAPTLIVWGRQDQVNDLEMAELTHKTIKGSKLVVLETDHFVPTKLPDQFNKAVLDFLA
jgi:pimeloyl-ACP methyl ester carboxylesterase